MIPSIRPILSRKPNLVWLASYPKSGSTWMRMFLHAYLTDGTVDINAINETGELGDLRKSLYKAVAPGPLEEIPETETLFLRTAALYRLACLEGDQLVKTHCCNGRVFGIELIPREFTKGAIYLVRDPRDVAISYAHHLARTIDETIDGMVEPTTMTMKENRYQYMATWSAHVESWVSAPAEHPAYPVLIVRYEDMLEKPFETFRHVAHAMTGKCDDDLLQRSIEASSFDRVKEQERESGFLECSEKADRFFRSGKSEWRDVLTPDQIERIERDHGKTMQKLGYPVHEVGSGQKMRSVLLPRRSALSQRRQDGLPDADREGLSPADELSVS